VAEDGGNLEAPRTFDVHEETIRALYETLKLVGAGLLLSGGVQQIYRHLTISNSEY